MLQAPSGESRTSGQRGGHRWGYLTIVWTRVRIQLGPRPLAVKAIRPGLGAAQDTLRQATRRCPADGRIPWPILLFIALAGCGPSDPLDIRVDAKNYIAFSMWEADAGTKLTAQQLSDFNEALQEIRFRIMADGTAPGGTGVEQASWAIIDDKTIRDVLWMGLGRELERVQAEQAALAKAMGYNRRLYARPDDIDSKNYLSYLRERDIEHLNELNAQMSHVRESLAAYGLPVDIVLQPSAGASEASGPASEDGPPVQPTQRNSDR